MNSINDISIDDYMGFVFDGCHKIYLVKHEDISSVNKEWGKTPVYNMEDLPECYKHSCPLKFISAWDLKTHFVRQGEENVKFTLGEKEVFVE